MALTAHSAIGMIAAASLIGVASWIGRRWGAGAGGWFVALPLISGPVLLTYALERGASFLTQACLGAILATISLSAFALAYGWVARRTGWPVSALLACGAFLGCTWALQSVHASSLGWTFIVACGVLIIALALALMPPASAGVPRATTPAWEIALRMLMASALVWVLAAISSAVGPRAAGLLTPFPITSTILVSFIHHGEGSAAASQFLRGLLKGLFSFALFVLAVGVVIRSHSILISFLAATVVTLAFHAGVWHWVKAPAVTV